MMLETGNPTVQFAPRLVEGVTPPQPKPDLERLILDGQQRLTSLFQVLLSGKPVKTKDARGKEVHRWYYIDINEALKPNSDREKAIISVPEGRIIQDFRGKVIADYSTTAKECLKEVFPLQFVFDTPRQFNWMQVYLQLDPANMQASLNQWTKFVQEVIQPFQQYQVPIILLSKETPREAVCQVFEKVNTGGVFLTVFELLTASYAAGDDAFNLREDWEKRQKKLKKLSVLSYVQNTEFLQAVTLLASRASRENKIQDGTLPENAPAISCDRKDILNLTLAEYKTWADKVTEGFEKTAQFLHTLKIFIARDLPYQPQITALAAIFASLGDSGDNAGVRAKLERWYWCGIFGEIYSGSTDTRLAKDLLEVLTWINGGSEPDTIISANFTRVRLLNLRTRSSAAYKGLSALLMRDGGRDFRSGVDIDTQIFFDDEKGKIDIHHIFPKAWCQKSSNNIEKKRWDSIINKTPISAKTNKMIGSKAPSKYLPQIEKQAKISPEAMDEILRSHVIDPVALRADNFDAFFQARQEALLERIEKAMGKNLVPVPNESVQSDDTDQDEDDDDLDND